METYIFLILSTFVLFVIIYIYITISSQNKKCDIINRFEYSDFKVPDLSGIPIKEIVFKSAYNCCCIGGMKNDYVDLCALKNCYRAGARVLDFQIFSLNNNPVISASTVNQNEYKELYNYLSFSETMNHINYSFLNSAADPNNNQVLFLNFRVNSNNLDIYNQMAKILIDTFTGGSEILLTTPVNKDLNMFTLNELKNKIIIMVDLNASPKMKDSFIKTDLSKITLVTVGNGFKYHSLYANEASLQSGVELSAIYPNKTARSNNYDYNDKGIRNLFNFIFMNFQKKDAYLNKYLEYFTDSTSFQHEYEDYIV
jgi:hypothetical protein